MSDLNVYKPQGMLHDGWTAVVDDYAMFCAWINNGESLLVADACGGLYSFDGLTGEINWQKKNTHEGGLLTMAIHPSNNLFATAGQNGSIMIWDSKTYRVLSTIELGRGWVEHLKWSPDGKSLAVAMSRYAYVFDHHGKKIWQSTEHNSTVSAISWSSSNELATASYGGVMFFDIANDVVNQNLEWKGSLVSMVLSPDGDIVACGSQDKSVHFWRRSTELDAEMTGYPCKPSQLAFDQSGRFLATGGSEQITVWNFQGEGPEGTAPGQLLLHVEPVSSLNFANNSLLLASGSRDGSLLVWFLDDYGDGHPLGGVYVGDRISDIAWKPNDQAIATVNASGGINVYTFKLRESPSLNSD